MEYYSPPTGNQTVDTSCRPVVVYRPGFTADGYPRPNTNPTPLRDGTGAENATPETDRAAPGAGVLVAAVAGLAVWLVVIIVWRVLA